MDIGSRVEAYFAESSYTSVASMSTLTEQVESTRELEERCVREAARLHQRHETTVKLQYKNAELYPNPIGKLRHRSTQGQPANTG